MTWIMWLQDPVLREFAIQAGGGSFFANFTGNPAALIHQGFYNNEATRLPVGRVRSGRRPDAGLPGEQEPACREPVYGDRAGLPHPVP